MADATGKPDQFHPRNWRVATPAEFRAMCPQQKARFLAYEEPPKEVQGVMAASRQRVFARLAARKGRDGELSAAQAAERKRRDLIIGQLKSAEARNRVRHMKTRHQSIRVRTVNFLYRPRPEPTHVGDLIMGRQPSSKICELTSVLPEI